MKNLRTALIGLLSGLTLPATAWAQTVTLTSPTANQVFTAPASISLKASTSGTGIRKVEFYRGTTLIGSDSTSPYSLTWSNVAAGSYSLTAKAKNSAGTVLATSSAVAIVVNAPPTVSLTSPTANQGFATGSSILLTANAADSDGSVSKVDFYRGTTLIGTATAAPYTVTWSNAAAGSYSLTAKATDNRGASKTSSAVAIVVAVAPTVSLTAPQANQLYTAPANVTLTATASPGSGGTLAKVDFFQGTTLIGTATASPYTVTWSNAPAGSYSLTAKATDSRNISTTSAAIPISVNAAGPALGMYFIHPDHLGTPRVITNSSGQTVWRWDNDEPFGDTLANENPSGLGPFPFNLRFPGQYFDRETGTHYNYYRDYDPYTGRYVQSDPIGLRGGINTYGYVEGNPVSNVDPLGLQVIPFPPRSLPPPEAPSGQGGGKTDGEVIPFLDDGGGRGGGGSGGGGGSCGDRNDRCGQAFMQCTMTFAGDIKGQLLCRLSYAACLGTNLPTIFPNGQVVW